MTDNKRVEALINLDNIIYNLTTLYESLGKDTPILAVLKADGYGHGALPIAKALEGVPFIWGYALATAEEALALRDAGIEKPMLILGYVFKEDMAALIEADVRLCACSIEEGYAISKAASFMGRTAHVHVKLDTGMHRIGFDLSDESVRKICELSELPGIQTEGLFTHFARADENDRTSTEKQYSAFKDMESRLKAAGCKFDIVHCCNSAGILRYKDYKNDMVRSGITTYGLWPSDELKDDIKLKPALSMYSHVSFVKELEAGEAISYGGTFVTKSKCKIATVPVGYADGYPRSLSDKGYVFIRGQKAPIRGRICMDQFMVDVTDIEGVSVRDKVTLIGDGITVDELGDLSGRFNYEFVCDLNKRIKRSYVFQNKKFNYI